MNISLTPTDKGFELVHPNLPAPLALSSEAGQGLAKALASDEITTPAFKSDKNVFSPQSREPLGLWVLEDGTIQLWIAGLSETLTLDQARALATDVLLASAKFKVGDEVVPTAAMYLYEQNDLTRDNWETNGTRTGELHPGEVVTICEVLVDNTGALRYRLTDGKSFTIPKQDGIIEAAPPIQNWSVSRNLLSTRSDVVVVSARTPAEASKLASLTQLPPGFQISDLEEPVVVTKTDDELNAEEGFVENPNGTLDMIPDGPLKTPQEVCNFIFEKAITGSRRHQGIARRCLAPA